MGRLEDINDTRNTLWNRGASYGVEECLMEISETLAMIYDRMDEKKTAIDKSDFSPEQYEVDLQSAYDCGYNQAPVRIRLHHLTSQGERRVNE